MIRKVSLSKRTETKLAKLLNYLEAEWSVKVKSDFIRKLDKSLSKIVQFPESFPKTDIIRGLHKCVVTKQTTIFYKHDDKKIYVVALFDTRQNPKKIKSETSE